MLTATSAQAQLAPDSARLVLKAGVLRLLSRTYQLEAEYRLARPVSLTLAPRLLAGTVPSGISPAANEAGDKVRGYGLSLGPRFYLPGADTEGAQLAGLYLGLKVDYQQLRLSYQREAWAEDPGPDGLLYYTFRPRELTESIRRVGGVATIGYQCQVFSPRFRIDAAASLNRLSSTSSAGNDSRYLTSANDYGYSGSFFTLDLNLGFVLK
ncbi:hypothetical protein [Hymenobacter saemangeumensis]|uniref:hypothetical protein n=1 Tax=Hymenobacter saemangeumensis TaxID=1084522 RepID=UPI0031ECEA6D